MSWSCRQKILFCAQVFFGLCNAIVSNEGILKSMSPEERKSIFGTEDGSIQECEVVELLRPLRSKRSGKNPITITINAFDSYMTTTLNVVEDDDLISRRRTGVWAARSSPIAYQNVTYDPWPHMFDTIGDFEFFQNVEEGSAVTRFLDSDGNESIMGIIKQNYTIKSLSKAFEYALINIKQKHELKRRSVNSMNDQDKKQLFVTICKNATVPQEYFRRDTYAKIDVRPDPNLHRLKRQCANSTEVKDVVYPKLLVIPDFRTVNRYTDVRDLMMLLIAQLNSIDMMFRQLKNPEVHLSIAGIIIPSDDAAVPYMSEYMNADNQIIGVNTVFEAVRNFGHEYRRFPHDEWESILMLTGYPIVLYTDNMERRVQVDGLSSMAESCKRATIVRFSENMKGIFTAAHELGHSFGANHDKVEPKCKDLKGYLMGDYNFPVKFEWSHCSQTALKTYFRSHAQQCYYYRRWRIPNAVMSMPGAWLTIDRQCDNLYNDSTGFCKRDRLPDCFIYGCMRNGTCDWTTDLPPEGSLILNTDGLQACINGTMVPV